MKYTKTNKAGKEIYPGTANSSNWQLPWCITIGVSKTNNEFFIKLPSMLSEASLDALVFYDKWTNLNIQQYIR